MRKILVILLVSFTAWSLHAQTTIRGVIKDEHGEALIGVTVLQKGTVNGTITDLDGKFSLFLRQNGEQTLVISSIGFANANVSCAGKTFIEVVLKESVNTLEEMVVVGYGTQKKVSMTGAISNLDNEEIASTPVASVTNALTGRVPGLVTRQESGRPGGDGASIFIRGRASLNDASPLVLVDGVERPMSQIDPEDIASISVLKDASATAVYGVRGANGVILVTTKRGKEGETNISLSAEYGITSFNRITQTLGAAYVSRFMREGLINDGFDPSNPGNSRNILLSEYDNYLYRTQKSPFTHPDNNFVDMFTKNGHQQKYNISFSKGTERVKSFVSIGYFNQTGMFETDVDKIKEHETIKRLVEFAPDAALGLYEEDYDSEYRYRRLTARSNVDIKLSDDLSLAVNLSYRFSNQNRPRGYDSGGGPEEGMRLFGMFYRNSPQAFPILNPNGSFASTNGVWRQNPLITLAHTGFRKNFSNNLESDFSFKYNLRKVVEGLSIDGRFSYDANWSNWRGINSLPNVFRYNPQNGAYIQGGWGGVILPTKESGKEAASYRKYTELALRYKQDFSGHHVSGLLLYNMSHRSFPGGDYSYVPHIYQALVGRVSYDYEHRYLFEVNAGYNGSNRFAKGNRYQLFPAMSLGWILTNEPYFPQSDVLTFSKLRFSYGEVGNDKLGGFSYYYRSTYNNGESYSFGEIHSPGLTGLIQGRNANDAITWEAAKKYNLGLETKWLNNSVSFNVDVFKERRSDILTNPQRYSSSAGSNGLAPLNYGIVENEGYELELGYDGIISDDLSFFAKAIYAYAHNEIIEKSEAAKPYLYMRETGNSIGQRIGYQFDGFFNSHEEIATSPTQFGQDIQLGDMKYKDINKDGIVDESDKAPIGYTSVPEITYSLSTGIVWKDFDLNVLFQGAAHASVYLMGDVAWDNTWGNYYEEHINRWTPETAETASYPRFVKSADPNAPHFNYKLSDYWLRDASYLRLKNVQLGYTLPDKIKKRLKVGSIRLYANAFNLYTWDSLKKVDPESPNGTNGFFYPQQKVINFGLDLKF